MTTITRRAPIPARQHDPAHEHPTPPGRAWLRVSVWLGLCLLALWVLAGGHSDLYLAPNIRWTLWAGIAVTLALAALDALAAWARGDRPAGVWTLARRSGWRQLVVSSYAALFVPVVVGIAAPPAVLGAGSILAHDGVVTLVAAPRGAPAVSTAPLDINLLRLHDRMQGAGLAPGTIVQVVGFVYHQPGLPAGEWLLTRFITPHCVAEAQPMAILVRLTGRSPPDNAWVRVTGAIGAGNDQGQSVAILDAGSMVAMGQPLDPYLIY